jgi:hypothetical protein
MASRAAPLSSFPWCPCGWGLVFALVSPALRRARPLVWLFAVVAVLLAASGSARPHYLAPAYPIVSALGGHLAERLDLLD